MASHLHFRRKLGLPALYPFSCLPAAAAAEEDVSLFSSI
jgi:hypothetical protein